MILTGALGLAVLALAQQPRQFIADKVVAVVGGSPVLYSEVAEQAEAITRQYREQNYTSPRPAMSEALEILLEQKLLYQRAQIDSIGLDGLASQIASTVEANVDEMTTRAGSIRALEAEQHKPLYTIKDDMTKLFEEVYGAQEMRAWVTSPERVKITPGEVDRFFRRIDPDSLPIIPEQYVYAQITKLPSSTEVAKQRTRESLLELRQRIIDGERFDRLAVMYSVDPGSALRGGDLGLAPKDQWHQSFGDAMAKLQPGQTSGVVETPDGFHIIQLVEKEGDNLYRARHILMKPTYSDDELRETVTFLDSLAGAIRREEITFAEAALKHSDDKGSKMNGGIVSNQALLFRYAGDRDPKSTRTKFIRDALDQYDATQLVRLKEGEISAAFVGQDFSMNQMGKMLKLVKVIPAHKANLAEDWLDIEQMALARKQETEYSTWLNARIDEMYVRIDPMFSPDDFNNKRWFK